MDIKASMSSYKAQVEQYGMPISAELFKELRSYANERGIKLSGFKDFVGDIETIKTVIDDICEIAKDFPSILNERNGIWLELDYNLGTDFATTENGHIIHLNAVYFSDIGILIKDYDRCVNDGRFVRGTNWRAIVRHEVGHVVSHAYNIDPMKVSQSIKGTNKVSDILDVLTDELSVYSTEFEDGREIISECFSAHYGRVSNSFADRYIEMCILIRKMGGEKYEIME